MNVKESSAALQRLGFTWNEGRWSMPLHGGAYLTVSWGPIAQDGCEVSWYATEQDTVPPDFTIRFPDVETFVRSFNQQAKSRSSDRVIEGVTTVRIIVIRGDERHEVLHADMLESAADRLISEIEATSSECSACKGGWTDCTEECVEYA